MLICITFFTVCSSDLYLFCVWWLYAKIMFTQYSLRFMIYMSDRHRELNQIEDEANSKCTKETMVLIVTKLG